MRILLVLPLLLFADPAALVWKGTGMSASMSVAGNWDPEDVPGEMGAGQQLTFPSTGGLSLNPVNDIPGSLLIGEIIINGAYEITGANSFSIPADHGYILSLDNSGGADINLSADPGVILGGTWQIEGVAATNTISTRVQVGSNGNLYLTQGTLILAHADNQNSGVLTVGTEAITTPAAYLQAGAAGAFGSEGFEPVTTVSSTSTLDLDGFDNTLGSLGGSTGASVILGSATLTITNGSAQVPFYGVIEGSGNLDVEVNELALLATNTYTGTTTIGQGGSLALLTPSSTSGIVFAAGGGELTFGQSGTFTQPIILQDQGTIGIGSYSVTLSGNISGAAESLAKTGPGTLTLTGTNTTGGNIHIWGGTLLLNSASASSITGVTWDPPTPAIGRLKIGSGITELNVPIALTGGPGIIDTNGQTVTISGAVQGGHFLQKEGTGTLILTAPGNNWAAKTKISRGTLNVTPLAYNTSTETVFMGDGLGTLQIATNYTPFASPVVFMQNGSIDTNGFAMAITGIIAGGATFNKIGSGTLTISGDNLFTGTVHLAAGGILIESSSALGVTANVIIDASTTLNFQNYTANVGSVSNAGSILAADTITTTAYSQTGLISLDFSSDEQTPYGNVVSSGTISLNGTLNITDTGGYTPSAATEIILFDSTTALAGTFASVFLPAEFSGAKLQYAYDLNQVILGFTTCNGNWQTATNGSWGATANWDGGCVPGVGATASEYDVAAFPNVATNNVTVTLPTATVTLHEIDFDADTTSYLIVPASGTSTIVLATPDSVHTNPHITLTNGEHTVNAPIILGSNANFSASSGTLTLGASSSVTGPYTLSIIQGASSGVVVNEGALTPATLSISGGNLLISSDNVNVSTFIQSSGTLTLDFATSSESPSGQVTAGTISLSGGALSVTDSGDYMPSSGVEITLLSAANSLSGTFSSISLAAEFADGTVRYQAPEKNIVLAFPACNGTWDSAANGNWSATANWNGGCPPGIGSDASDYDIATFPEVAEDLITVTLSQTATLHDIDFTSSFTSYSIIGSGPVVLDADDMITKPRINALAGDHTMNLPIILNTASRIVADSTLTLGASSSVTGDALHISGSGSVVNLGAMDISALYLESGTLRTSEEILTGLYTQSSGATLDLNLPTGLLTSSGTLNLSGSLIAEAPDGLSSLSPITLMTGDVAGAFTNVSYLNFPSTMIPAVVYNADSVVLTLHEPAPHHVTTTSASVLFSSVAQHNSFINRKSFQMRNLMNDTSPPEETYLAQALLPGRETYNLQRRDYKPLHSIYVGPIGEFGKVDAQGNQAGLSYTSVGFFAGGDVAFPRDPDYFSVEGGIGAILEWRDVWGDITQNAGSIQSQKLHGSIYGFLAPTALPSLFFDSIFGFAYTWDNVYRNAGPDNAYHPQGSTNESIWIFSTGVEYTSKYVTPLLHLQYVNNRIHGTEETGGAQFNLSIPADTIQSLITSLGARFILGNLEFDAEWLHEYLNNSQTLYYTPYTITSVPTAVTTIGAPRNSALFALDYKVTTSSNYQVEANGTLLWNSLLYDAFFFLSFGKLF